jgi:hypothetical protein
VLQFGHSADEIILNRNFILITLINPFQILTVMAIMVFVVFVFTTVFTGVNARKIPVPSIGLMPQPPINLIFRGVLQRLDDQLDIFQRLWLIIHMKSVASHAASPFQSLHP